MKISLLHATRGTPERANATREAWLARAFNRSMVEHIWGTQAGDDTSKALDLHSAMAITEDPPAWGSSSVANWNAAAAIATGDLLVVIADDLTPPIAWDVTLCKFVGNAKMTRAEFCIYVPDQLSDDGLLRHPVMSRGLYERRGYVFDPDYFGVFCDNDLTTWCHSHNVPAHRMSREALHFFHDHDMTGNAVTAQQNRTEAYEYGLKTYHRKWSALNARKVVQTHSVWIGAHLSRMERLTLKMLVAHGHKPTLWLDLDIFKDWDSIPKGVTASLIPKDFLPAVRFAGMPHPTLPNGGIGSFAQWSDWFACWVLSEHPGALWCQLDIAAIKPIHATANTFTVYSGGLSVCAFTLQPDLALVCHRAMAAMVAEAMAGRDWHDTMRLVQRIVVEAGVPITQFADFFDCGGRPSSPFNQPVAREDRPGLIHWSNATHGLSKDTPVPGSLYAELLDEHGV